MGIHTASAQHVAQALKKHYQALLLAWDAHSQGTAPPPVAKQGAPPPAPSPSDAAAEAAAAAAAPPIIVL